MVIQLRELKKSDWEIPASRLYLKQIYPFLSDASITEAHLPSHHAPHHAPHHAAHHAPYSPGGALLKSDRVQGEKRKIDTLTEMWLVDGLRIRNEGNGLYTIIDAQNKKAYVANKKTYGFLEDLNSRKRRFNKKEMVFLRTLFFAGIVSEKT